MVGLFATSCLFELSHNLTTGGFLENFHLKSQMCFNLQANSPDRILFGNMILTNFLRPLKPSCETVCSMKQSSVRTLALCRAALISSTESDLSTFLRNRISGRSSDIYFVWSDLEPRLWSCGIGSSGDDVHSLPLPLIWGARGAEHQPTLHIY